ncbi:hypothetical protein [Paenibacillus xylanexedens]|nr:hypothetical protein [Paenibacillus xylanexedens]
MIGINRDLYGLEICLAGLRFTGEQVANVGVINIRTGGAGMSFLAPTVL